MESSVSLPGQIDDEIAEASHLWTQQSSIAGSNGLESLSSRNVLWHLSSLIRSRELTHMNREMVDKKIMLLHDYLKKAHRPFADAVVRVPDSLSDLKVDVIPPGLICFLWYDPVPLYDDIAVSTEVGLIYLLGHPQSSGGYESDHDTSFVLGRCMLSRPQVLATARHLGRLRNSSSVSTHGTSNGAQSVRELLRPRQRMLAEPSMLDGTDTESSAPSQESLEKLSALLDPTVGGELMDPALCLWLAHLLRT